MSLPESKPTYPPEYGFDGMGAAINITSMSVSNNGGIGSNQEAEAISHSSKVNTTGLVTLVGDKSIQRQKL